MKTANKVLGPFLAFALAFASGASVAQSYPNKPIKFVVGYGPGGGTDILARMIGQKLAEQPGPLGNSRFLRIAGAITTVSTSTVAIMNTRLIGRVTNTLGSPLAIAGRIDFLIDSYR